MPGGRGSPRSPKVLAQGKCDKCWAAKGTWQVDLGTALVGSNYNRCHVCIMSFFFSPHSLVFEVENLHDLQLNIIGMVRAFMQSEKLKSSC